MITHFLKKLFGNKQARDMKRMLPIIDEINAYFEEYQSLSEEELRGKTAEFRQRLAEGETLDDLLPEAFAVVKEACRRHIGQSWVAAGIEITWDMVPYDVQMAGGIALHQGKIAEMATGEGKTLVAVAPLYLNALAGQGAHLVTVNDYLARRDSEWMGKIFEYLGLTVGCLDKTQPNTAERRAQYEADITYGTNHEFGFDYLRDNMVTDAEHMVQQRGHFYAIVDEVDNILIDEARTPLIISGPVERSTHRYNEIKPIVAELVKKQNDLANRLLAEAEELLKQGPGSAREAGIRLLQVQRALPKHKRLMKLKGEPGINSLIEKTELEFMAEKKLNDLDEEVYYVVDEKSHQIDLTEKGRQALSPANPKLWEMPDIVEEIAAIDAGEFEVIETTDGHRVLLNGTEKERQAARRPDGGFEIPRHDGIQRIPADMVKRVIPGSEIERGERDSFKEMIRADHAVQAEKLHNISQMLRAYTLYERDKEYVVQDNKVIIVDEFTGRLMTGRRWSDGLHQAVEAKEGVEIEIETQTLATVTLQNYFRMYKKLAGMTGTAETEASEFTHTYKMDVVVIPTNRPTQRVDHDDVIFKTKREKYNAVIAEIERCHAQNLPVLVGTTNVEVSEVLSRMLQRKKIPHNVLNAKLHQREAEIVRFAGQPGAVTIATNMAGRGTDIKLHPDVVYPGGGLQIIGTERHDARRIDRQLRGRAGRQGDPGSSRFYLSLEDDLMRLFGAERISRIMDRLGLQEGEEITHPWVTKAIESAQKKVEARNFEMRKRTLDYDNVMNKQREAIYGLRREVLTSDDLKEVLLAIHYDAIRNEINEFGDVNRPAHEWDLDGFLHYLHRHIPYLPELQSMKQELEPLDADGVMELIMPKIEEAYDRKLAELGPELMLRLARYVVLRHIDDMWRDHLLAIDDLRESIGWRGYAQLDPLVEYQKEASLMFEELMFNLHKAVLEHFFLTQPVFQMAPPEQVVQGAEARHATLEETLPPPPPPQPSEEEMLEALTAGLPEDEQQPIVEEDGYRGPERRSRGPAPAAPAPRGRRQAPQPVRVGPKVSPNSPCPCGSGKKYKKCCGSSASSHAEA